MYLLLGSEIKGALDYYYTHVWTVDECTFYFLTEDVHRNEMTSSVYYCKRQAAYLADPVSHKAEKEQLEGCGLRLVVGDPNEFGNLHHQDLEKAAVWVLPHPPGRTTDGHQLDQVQRPRFKGQAGLEKVDVDEADDRLEDEDRVTEALGRQPGRGVHVQGTPDQAEKAVDLLQFAACLDQQVASDNAPGGYGQFQRGLTVTNVQPSFYCDDLVCTLR